MFHNKTKVKIKKQQQQQQQQKTQGNRWKNKNSFFWLSDIWREILGTDNIFGRSAK
jgi:hypothetical protein